MKIRLDVQLVNRNLAESREKAKAIIMSGNVFVEGQREDKVGTTFEENANIEVRGNLIKYVSRGGLKLEKAIENFGINLNEKVCMDIGASTGGFTDCMLMNGALKVYSVDVGHGQLAWKLRQDKRVVVMEKTNARYLEEKDILEKIDFASVDVSFISLTKIIPPVKKLLSLEAQMVCLIKPQFEAGREKVGKKGVVKDKAVHKEVVLNIGNFVMKEGFEILDIDFSPIKGPEGNIEYLIYIKNLEEPEIKEIQAEVNRIIDLAHQELN